MKRSLFRLCLLAIASLACLLVDLVGLVIDRTAVACRKSRDWVIRLVMVPISMCSARAGVIALKPVLVLIAARSFFTRCVQRARPRVEAQWRLCASA